MKSELQTLIDDVEEYITIIEKKQNVIKQIKLLAQQASRVTSQAVVLACINEIIELSEKAGKL